MGQPSRRGWQHRGVWIALVGLVALALLLSLGHLNPTRPASTGQECWSSALRWHGALDACEENLAAAVVHWDGADDAPDVLKRLAAIGHDTPNRMLLWLDNLAVILYSAFFAGSIGAAYRRVTAMPAGASQFWRAAVIASLLLVAAGALADYIENFWLLAHMHAANLEDPASYMPALPAAAQASAWKFRLFTLNAASTLAWWCAVAWRYVAVRRRSW